MHSVRFSIWTSVLIACAAFAGCKQQRTFAPTYSVHGNVTLDAKPLAEGVITFISSESGDLQAIQIKDGKYEGQVRAGTRRVEIRAFKPRTGPKKPLEPPPHNFLPARYNGETTLSANVAEQGANTFDFQLQSN